MEERDKRGGQLSIHPLMKSYDEARRGADRVRKYLKMNKPDITQDRYKDCQMMIEKFEEIMTLTPEPYRKNTYEIKKLYREDK